MLHRRRRTTTTATPTATPTAASVALVVGATVAAVLGAWRLTTASEVGDEVVYRGAATEILRGGWTSNQQHPPLAKELIALFRATLTPLGVPDLAADRLVGVVCFVATGVLVAALARRLAGPWPGLGAALLWWLLPLAPGVLVQHVDRYALLEGPVVVFTVAAVLAACRVLDRPTTSRWAVAGACVGLATASKLTGVLSATAVVTVAVALLLRRAGPAPISVLARSVIAGAVSVAVFGLTYLPMGPATARQALITVVTFQLDHAADGHTMLIGGQVTASPPWWVPFYYQSEYLGWAGVAALWAAAVVGGLVATRRPGGPVVASTAAVVTLALVSSSLKLPHYHAALVPLLCVLAAVGLSTLAGLASPRRWPALLVAAAVVVALAIPAARGIVRTLTLRPDDYAAAAMLLRERELDEGPVAVWGDRLATGAALPRGQVTVPADPDCGVPALLIDRTIAPRLDVDVDGWLARCGSSYEPTRFAHVTVWLPRG